MAGTGIAEYSTGTFLITGRGMDMTFTETKFEALILRILFAACTLVCGMILTALVATKATPVQWAANGPVSALFASAPSTCALPDVGNIVCIRAEG